MLPLDLVDFDIRKSGKLPVVFIVLPESMTSFGIFEVIIIALQSLFVVFQELPF